MHIQGACTIIAPPREANDCNRQLLFFKGPQGGAGQTGMSGGPAAIWDADSNEYILVGIYVGSLRTSILGIPTPSRDIGVVRRITNDDLREVGIQLPLKTP